MTTCPMAHFRVMFASFSKRAWKVALKLFKRYTCNNNSFFFFNYFTSFCARSVSSHAYFLKYSNASFLENPT